jgi:hypothetical protein
MKIKTIPLSPLTWFVLLPSASARRIEITGHIGVRVDRYTDDLVHASAEFHFSGNT